MISRPLSCLATLLVASSVLPTPPSSSGYAWRGYAGDPQHDAISTVQSQPLKRIKWTASLDDDRSYYGTDVFIHFASPCITAKNTVIHSYRYTTQVSDSPDYDNWRVYARNGSTGQVLWQMNTDYSAAVVYPSDWTSVYPLGLAGKDTVVAAGGGGTVLIRPHADDPSWTAHRIAFYGLLAQYEADSSLFSGIKICTPFTTDADGNIWFGYLITGSSVPDISALGTGGVVRISTSSGLATYRSVENLGFTSGPTRPAINAAPALSRDGKSIYVGLSDGGYSSVLVKLDSSNLTLMASVALLDPGTDEQPARLLNESSASPMVAPDGHVFYGVFGNQERESHGWMLQFDGDLHANQPNGVRWPEGAFGWDDTASVVDSKLVPSYRGAASYLILTKYNNYAWYSGNGLNHVAILDPTDNSTSRDRLSGIPVMNEISLILGPTADVGAEDSGFPNAVDEWCINSAVIDPFTDSAIVNSEDGHCYRWDLARNKLTEGVSLAVATGEAYTSTVIGPDGTCYAINNCFLCAVGK